MHKETRENLRQKKAVLLAAGIVCLVCFSIMWFTVGMRFAAPLHLLCLAAAGIAVYFITRFALRRYTYALEENTLTLLLQDGSRLPVMEELHLSPAVEFAPLPAEGLKKNAAERRLDFRFSFFREDQTYYLRYRREGTAFLLLFQPSDSLVAKIREAMTAQ